MAFQKPLAIQKLEWKLQKLNVKHESDIQILERQILSRDKRIQSLEKDLKALQEGLNASHKEKKELTLKINACEREKGQLTQALDLLNAKVKEMVAVQEELEQKITDMQEAFKQSLVNEAQKHEENASKMQAVLKLRCQMEKEKAHQELTARHRQKSLEIQREFREQDERNKKVIWNLEKALKEHETALRKIKKIREEEKKDHGVRVGELKLNNEEMAQKIKNLKQELKLFHKKTSDLQDVLKFKDITVADNNQEMRILKSKKKAVVEEVDKLVWTIAILQAQVECAQERVRALNKDYNEEVALHKLTIKDLNKAQRQITKLTGRVRSNKRWSPASIRPTKQIQPENS